MPKNNEKNILVARLSALGDVAMTIPVLYDACLANPERHFIFLTKKRNASCFIESPPNLSVEGIDFDNYRGLPGIFRLARELRNKYNIDTFIDLHDVLRTQIMRVAMHLTGVKVFNILKGRRSKRALTRRNNKILLPLVPTIRRYAEVFHRAGIKLEPAFTSIFGKGRGAPEAFGHVTPPPAPGEVWIAIAPFAKHKGKIYPLNQMKEVVDVLAKEPGRKLFIFGFGEEEEKKIETLKGDNPNVYNMAKLRIGFPAELALLSHCRVMLSMDSANQHLASLVGTRVISIWGATHPYTGFLAWNQSEKDCVQLDIVCRPCSVFGDKPCMRGDYQCLVGISPQLIISKVNEAAGYSY